MKNKNPRKCLSLLLFLFFLLSQTPNPSFSQPLHSNPTFTHFKHSHLCRILLGVLFGSLTGLFASILLLFAVRLFLLFTNRTPILKGPVVFSPAINPKSLQLALAAHSQSTQLLASTHVATHFELSLNNSLVVTVKLLKPNSPNLKSNSTKRRIQRELELLARVDHKHVMSLRAYVLDQDWFFLVYDCFPNGSLEDAMKRVRSNQLVLGWEARHRIAVGVAKGLRYLHFECNPVILHYGVKPGSVMLDEGFEPRLGDCRLGRLQSGGFDAMGSECYVAPECFQSCRYTDKSDVFSFGVILGVLLTGRDPSEPVFSGEAATGRGGLGRWLRQLQQAGEAREALDKAIIGEEGEEEEMLMAIRIALVCLSDVPADRPSSDELAAMLTQLHSF